MRRKCMRAEWIGYQNHGLTIDVIYLSTMRGDWSNEDFLGLRLLYKTWIQFNRTQSYGFDLKTNIAECRIVIPKETNYCRNK